MKRILLLLAACLLFAVAADAAVVHLKDGSRIRGTVVGATARDVTIHTEDGVQRISVERIARIDYADGELPPTGAPPPDVPAPRAAPRVAPYDFPVPAGNHELSLLVGLGIPLSNADFGSVGGGRPANGGPGPRVGFDYLGAVDRRLSAGFAFEYFHRGAPVTHRGVPSAETEISGDTILLLGQLRYAWRPGRATRPYLRGALGAHRTTTIVDAAPELNFVWADTLTGEARRLARHAGWGYAMAAAVGLQAETFDPLFMTFELGWLGLSSVEIEPTAAGRAVGLQGSSRMLHALTLGARWGWRF